MNETSSGARGEAKKRFDVKWFTLVFGGAILFLAFKISSYEDPRLTPALAAELARLSKMFFALGGVSVAAVVTGALWRSPTARLVDLAEALAYLGVGGALFTMRGKQAGGSLFDSPLLPAVLLVLGGIKMLIVSRDLKKVLAAPAKKK